MLTGLLGRSRDALGNSAVGALWQSAKDRRELPLWEEAGRTVPPPHLIKQRIVSSYASAFGIDTLIETGTYRGKMVYAMRKRFRVIRSIELSSDLARRASRRFRGFPNIQILTGDSAEVLPRVLNSISSQCLFWLDGHYSGGITAKGKTETPVMTEVQIILDHGINDHVILIDDARCFDGTHDYPTLDELRQVTTSNRLGHDFSVANDVIRIHPKRRVHTEF